jgi:hypothetical protein
MTSGFKRVIGEGVPLLAGIGWSVELASRHCLPHDLPTWRARKQCPTTPLASFSSGKQWHTALPSRRRVLNTLEFRLPAVREELGGAPLHRLKPGLQQLAASWPRVARA